MPFLQPNKHTFLWDKASMHPACVLLQALYGGNREVCFVFPDWEIAPTKTMVKVTETGRQIEELANVRTTVIRLKCGREHPRKYGAENVVCLCSE